jgi:nitronate monooxygenase
MNFFKKNLSCIMGNENYLPLQTQKFMAEFKLQRPFLQSPMAGADNNQLAAAVYNAGGLGARGLGYLAPSMIKTEIEKLKAQIGPNINVNLFVPNQSAAVDLNSFQYQTVIKALIDYLMPHAQKLDCVKALKEVELFDINERFYNQASVAIELKPRVMSITFGYLPDSLLKAAKHQGIKVIATATNVAEGLKLMSLGYDAIVAQGAEAGGHRGSFIIDNNNHPLSTLALVEALAPVCRIPIIAAGGIRSYQQTVECLSAGASAVQVGTALLVCNDCTAISLSYQKLINKSIPDDIQSTSFISGRPATSINNYFYHLMNDFYQKNPDFSVLPYPIPHLLSAPLRAAATKQNNADYVAAWCGKSSVPLPAQHSIKSFTNSLFEKDYFSLKLK